MRTRHLSIPVLASVTLFLGALDSPVYSKDAQTTPKQVIQAAAEDVRAILRVKTKPNTPRHKQQMAKLKKIVDQFVDYTELGKRSLGPHWKDRSAKEQQEFVQTLRDLIEESYTRPISDNIDFTMQYEDEELSEDGKATVWSIASSKDKKGKPVSEDLTFHLYRTGEVWKIYDIEFGDVSMVRHYRGEFNRKIKKESFEALMQAMRKKLNETKKGKSKASKQPRL